MSAWTARMAPLALALLIAACADAEGQPRSEARQPLTARAAKMRAGDIREKAVTGELLGRPFTASDVRLQQIKIPGHERVDLIFSEKAITTCGVPGQPVSDRSTRVWVRALEKASLEQGEYRVEPDGEGPVRAYFEVFEEDGWRGVGQAAALLVVDEVGDGTMLGRLEACFDDGRASCVKGRFLAKACRSPLDLDMLGERFVREQEKAQ